MAKAILFDLDGVFYQGDATIPGAAQTVAWVQGQGIPHGFLTNTTSRPRRALVEKLSQRGMAVDATHILTPPVAAASWLKAHTSGPVALFVPQATWEDFDGLPLAAADQTAGVAAVVVGDLGEGWDFKTLNRAFRLLMAEPPPVLLALGMTRYWRAADGLRLDTAPFIVALEHAAGVQAVVVGKPAAPFFEAALAMTGASAGETVMVGDDIRADIDSAQRMGMTGVLVQTGKFRPSDLGLGIAPTAIIPSIADFPAWWQTLGGP